MIEVTGFECPHITLRKVKSLIRYKCARFGNPIKQCTVGGYVIKVDVSEGIQRWIYAGRYEPVETKWFKEILKPGMTVVDIGASVGYYSFLASALVGNTGMVYAFEPSTYSFEKFTANIQRNAIKNIEPYRIGLGDTECEKEMFNSVGDNPENIHAPTFIPQDTHLEHWRSIGFLPIMRLDKFWEDNHLGNIDLVKIDVEGFESAVLGGMINLFKNRVVKRVMVEYLQTTEPLFFDGTESSKMDFLLESNGFRLVKAKRHDFGNNTFMGNFLYELEPEELEC